MLTSRTCLGDVTNSDGRVAFPSHGFSQVAIGPAHDLLRRLASGLEVQAFSGRL